MIADLVPDAEHRTEQCANIWVESDHARSKARLRPMRGLKTDRTASIAIRSNALVQNIRPGHDQFNYDTDPTTRLEAAFDELVRVLHPWRRNRRPGTTAPSSATTQQTPGGWVQ